MLATRELLGADGGGVCSDEEWLAELIDMQASIVLTPVDVAGNDRGGAIRG